jgi:hypothetical protein
MENNRFRIGIIEEIQNFFWAIAIVGINRSETTFEGRYIGFKIFRTVVEIGGNFALMGEAMGDHVGSQGVGSGVELAPRYDSITMDLTWVIRNLLPNRFVNVGEIPTSQNSPLQSPSTDGN